MMKTKDQIDLLEAISCISTEVNLHLKGSCVPVEESMEALGGISLDILKVLKKANVLPEKAMLYDTNNELNPLKVIEQEDEPKIKTLSEWFEQVSNSKAFIVNGMICSDFSFPSPDDEMDDSYSFYMYGANGVYKEVFVSSSDVTSLKVMSFNQIICDLPEGSYTFQALS